MKTLLNMSSGQYFFGQLATPRRRPMYWIWEAIRMKAGARIVTSWALSWPAAARLAATPTPAPQESHVARSTVMASPGRSKAPITPPQVSPRNFMTPKRFSMYVSTKAISTFGSRL